ncbi:MAG: ATP-binding cassette domain-containing protein [Pseudomonadales bacterium]|nr:ATP-binding cassette domain-containing protein [Pseudomonadales bacterium]
MDDELNRPPSRRLTSLRPALAFLRPYLRQVGLASAALVVTAGVTLSIGQGMRLVIDRGLAGGASAAMLEQTILVFALLMVALTVGTFVRFYYVSWIGERVAADIRFAVFRHIIRLHPGFFEVNQPTEIQSRITTDTTLLQTVIGSSVSIALRNALMFLGGIVLLFVTNAKLSLVVVASVPFVVAPVVLFGRRVRGLSRSSQDTIADVGSYAGESLRYIKVVQSFNHEPIDESRFGERVERAFAVAVRRVTSRAILIALVMLLVMAAIATMLWIGGLDVLRGATSPGELAAFIFYAFIVAGSVGAISEVYSDLQRAAGATERLMELLQARSILPEPAAPAVIPDGACGRLALRDVVFSYPTRPQQRVLDGLSLVVEPGEMVALVGPSGAGKSTLFDLVQRFHDPEAGAVLLDDRDLRSLALADVRGRIGYVPQESVLFAGTLRDNVRYGRPDATEADVRDALRQAHADGFIDALPDGLDTRVGEGGVGLSGGQKQRLAIARALLTRPRLLLLDEATSALDAESEEYIRDSIEALKGRCTILVIAHRLSTVRQADRILVLDAGRLVASGTHASLVRDSELYARFSRIQFGAAPDGTASGSVGRFGDTAA